jgi:hypothetical protein
MRADLKRIKLLFKIKIQPANSSSGQGWHNTDVDGQMHNGDIKIVELVEKHIQTKEKNQNERGRIRTDSRKENIEKE